MSNDSIGDDHTILPDPSAGRSAPIPPSSSGMDGRSIGDQHTYLPDSSPGSSVLPGTTIAGRYEVVRALGRGGMGEVHLCLDRRLNREVALKRVLADGALHTAALERFRREANAIAQLSHPNIVHLYDFGDDASGPYIVMELLAGSDLQLWVREHGKLASSEVLRIARQICQGLAYAHARGVVHRDLKPSNLFRLPDGSIKLLDFGLARDEDNTQMSLSGVGMGTLDYAAPEQRDDASKADARSDLYSLGATLYYLATGKSPKVVRERDLPDELRTLVLGLMEDQPSARPQSIQATVEAITAAERSTDSAPAAVESDDLRCPKCKAANSLEAKVCRSCRISLWVKCPACDAEHRLGLEYCDQCGASGVAVRQADGWMTEAKKFLSAGRLAEAQAQLGQLEQFLRTAVLGAAKSKLTGSSKELRTAIQKAQTEARAAVTEAASLASKGICGEALRLLETARAKDAALADETTRLQGIYTKQAAEIRQRVERLNNRLTTAGNDLRDGNLRATEEAIRAVHAELDSTANGDVSALLAKCSKFDTVVRESRQTLDECGREVKKLRATSKFEEAAELLDQADSIERGLDWIATSRKEVAAQIVARDAAIQAAIQAAAEVEQLVRQGKYRPARDLLDSHQRSLAAAAPGIEVKELQAADQFWSARKLRRFRLQLAAAVAFLMLLIAYEWQRRDLVAQARQLEAKLDESLSRAINSTGIGAAEYANAARPLLNALQERNESAAAFGLWWLVAARSSELESEIAVVDSLLNLQSRPDSLDHAGAQYLELRRASVLERVQTAAAVGDVVMLRSLAQAYTALIKDASAIRDVASCVDASRFAPLVAAWQAAVLADNATLADSAKREILALPRTGGVCAWSEVLVSAPNPSIITDSSMRDRISATGLPWRVKDRTTGIEMVLIPPGKYMRGASPGDSEAFDDERPAHEVTITKAFYMGVYEVTQGEWQKLMGNNPSHFQGDRLPVEQVSWGDTQKFLIKSKGLRLPTEGEWEYACRGGTTSSRYGELDAIGWYDGNSRSKSHSVGGKQANGFGVHDMLGNVWEWCSDWYGAYPGASQVDPSGPSSGENRVCRGGSWYYDVRLCRASYRRHFCAPAVRYNGLGFRVARTP